MRVRRVILALVSGLFMWASVQSSAAAETKEERDARMQWWRDAKFGMFIHYGLYSGLAGEFKGIPGGGEWIQCNLGLDTDTYAAETLPLFRPEPGCTEAWAARCWVAIS